MPFIQYQNRKSMRMHILFVVLFLISFASQAQYTPGIFVTRNDFEQGIPAIPLQPVARIKVKVNKDLFIPVAGETLHFKYRHLYGYSDGKFKYRAYGRHSIFADHGYYKVVYEDGIVLYSRKWKDHRDKWHASFYYSIKPDAPIVAIPRQYIERETTEKRTQAEIQVAALKRDLGVRPPEEITIVKLDEEFIQ